MPNPDEIPNESQARQARRPSPNERSRRFPWGTLLIVVILAVIGLVAWRLHDKKGAAEKQAPGARGGNFPAPVVMGTVTQKDIPIYLDGLGTVQAMNTVTVRSRVDGQLQKLSFNEGQDVHAGDLLAQIDPDPFRTLVEQAEGRKAQDEAQLANAQVELKRDAELLTNKIVSREVFDTQQAQVRQFTAAVQADQAAIDSARVQLNYTKITSPIDGRTGIRQVDPGNIVRANDTNGIVVVTQLKPISVIFTLPEQMLAEIQREIPQGEMKVIAVERDNHTVLDEGKLSVIDNQIDTSTGTIRLKATFPNEKLGLWPGQFVNTRLLLKIRTNATVVPASVVQRGPEGSYAFTVKDDMSAEMRPVKVALVEQDQAIIDSGLQSGEKVVVDGQYKLQPGGKVKPAGAKPENAGGANASGQGGTNHTGKWKKSGEGKK